MINAKPQIWEKLINDNTKVGKFRKNVFPLFNSLEALYDGSIATRDLNFTSTQSAPQRTEHRVEPTPQITKQRVEPAPQRSMSEQSTHNTVPSRNPFNSGHPFNSGLDGIESTEVQPAATNKTSEDVEGFSGKKRKQSQMAARLGDYIDFRKGQIEKTMKELNEKKKREEDYSVQNCIDIVDAIEELTDEQKADCNELF
ncbi:hypothetical protein PVAP13_4KG344600 [Panicum virgatum]|uniref:Uncharacterized protein n=1 Tax=Panicum virgatum TaxID=38727 RepID=A0A8T0TX05_PANVG|nr:hypothetical protein PVAP13_4KG344600 [Panicum virgatum]